MRFTRAAVCLLLTLPLLALSGPSATAATNDVAIAVPIKAATAAEPGRDKIYCDGLAPQEPLCRGSMVLTGPFDIVVAVDIRFRGALTVRGETPTGSVTIVCDQVVAPLDCWWEHAGVFMEGQTFLLTGVVTGMGNVVPSSAYWRIRVP